MDGDEPSIDEARPRGHRDRGRLRRRALVKAGAAILREGGREAITQRAVARRAGASLSAMTYYFADLDDMVTAAARQALRDRIQQIVRRQSERTPGIEPLDAELVDVVLPPGQEETRRIFIENVARMAQINGVSDQLDHFYSHLDGAMREVLRGQREFSGVEPRQLVALIFGAAALTPPGRDSRERARRLVCVYLDRYTAADLH